MKVAVNAFGVAPTVKFDKVPPTTATSEAVKSPLTGSSETSKLIDAVWPPPPSTLLLELMVTTG